jgi:hypothetical protein
MTTSSPTTKPIPPYRQIRAQYDNETITVYQAYSAQIGDAAVQFQKLSASSAFDYGRMTWIKPSWSWVCYRSGYTYKDDRQCRILALKMKHEHFNELLRQAFVGHGAADEAGAVRVQWDPERAPTLQKLPWRSIQIGIPRSLSRKWVEEWIISIDDVTERARSLKEAVEQEPGVSDEELVKRELVPVERVYTLPDDIKEILKMEGTGTSEFG